MGVVICVDETYIGGKKQASAAEALPGKPLWDCYPRTTSQAQKIIAV